MGLVNTHGIDYDTYMIIPSTKSMGNNIFLLEHTLEKHQHIGHVHGRDKITLKNSGAASEMACHQANIGTTKNHKLTYNILKKMIHEKQMQ
jgi:hypothetical protein